MPAAKFSVHSKKSPLVTASVNVRLLKFDPPQASPAPPPLVVKPEPRVSAAEVRFVLIDDALNGELPNHDIPKTFQAAKLVEAVATALPRICHFEPSHPKNSFLSLSKTISPSAAVDDKVLIAADVNRGGKKPLVSDCTSNSAELCGVRVLIPV